MIISLINWKDKKHMNGPVRRMVKRMLMSRIKEVMSAMDTATAADPEERTKGGG